MAGAGVAALLAVLIGGADPAGGKGPERATITGPSVDEPIDILAGDTPSYLVVALMELADPYLAGRDVELRSDQPTRSLNDGFTLTWHMARPHDADPVDYTVVQELYPDALGGPVVHVRPSEYLGDAGGWYRASPALRDTLVALGVPVDGLTTGLAGRSPVDPREAQTGEDPAPGPWPVAVAVAGTLGAALGVVLGITGTRRWTQRRSPTVPPSAAKAQAR